MGPTYAGILGALAFVLVLVRGLLEGSQADSIVGAAVGCLMAFAALGYLAGRLAEQALWESVRKQFYDERRAREAEAETASQRRK